ncbi:MAG: RNA methyltransferase [Planctomycetes bacterium]|nr:RNA methyltransferase [Planctomycetota bacterium]
MRHEGGRPRLPELPSPIAGHPLDAMLTESRQYLYRQVLARRVQNICVIVEDCHDPHNATAVIRSCDAYGIHHVHVTTSKNTFKINRQISQGTHRYVDLHVHENIDDAYAELRADGYTICVTDLGNNDLQCVNPDVLHQWLTTTEQPKKIALVFGSESKGISAAARAGADYAFLVPMSGFTQSLNLSVTVASTVYRLREHALIQDAAGDLSPQQQTEIYDQWVMRHSSKGRKGGVENAAKVIKERLIADADPRSHSGTDKKGAELEIFGSDENAEL